MNDEIKEKRCKFCGKLLIGEKIPICRRCKLKGSKVGQRVGIVGMITIVLRAMALAGDKEKVDSNSV